MTRVKSQNQSQVIRMERTHTLKKSFEILFVPEEDIQHVNWVGGNKWGKEAGEGWGGLTLILSVGERGLKLIFA